MSSDSNQVEKAGRAVGSFAKRVKDAADQGKWMEKTGKAVGSTYEKSTGRNSSKDGNIAGAVAIAGGTMLGTLVVIKAATTLATTVAVVGAGAAGAAVYCNARGKPKELDSLHDTAVHGMRNVAKGTGDFLSGVKQGVKQEGEQGKQA